MSVFSIFENTPVRVQCKVHSKGCILKIHPFEYKETLPRENDFKKKLIFLDILQGKVQRPLTGIDWKRYPKELAPSTIKKSKRTTTAKVRTDVKRKKLTDTAILDKLEKNEENEEKDDDDETSNPGGSVTNLINFSSFPIMQFHEIFDIKIN